MAKRRGGSRARQKMQELPERLLERILPRAVGAGAEVIAEEARRLLGGRRADTGGGVKVLIADAVKTRVRRKGTQIRARIMLQGPGSFVGRWLEYGTEPHFISVDPSVRDGRTPRRINQLISRGEDDLKGTLLINGKPVGTSVYHPGARPHPFLRPALDLRKDDAIAAMRTYVTSRAAKAGTTPGTRS